jgi:hypothetical protein
MRAAPPLRARLLAAVLLLATIGSAAAHAFLVLGELTVDPDPPRPGERLTIAIDMADPSLAPVEDAVVFVEVRRQRLVGEDVPAASTEQPDLPPPDVSIDLVETLPGRYEGSFIAPDGGTHHLLVRDQTFQWEEANASVMLEIGPSPVGTLPFILPPTAVGPRSLWVWLLWLIGVPLLAGLVVTALVLGNRSAGPESGSA